MPVCGSSGCSRCCCGAASMLRPRARRCTSPSPGRRAAERPTALHRGWLSATVPAFAERSEPALIRNRPREPMSTTSTIDSKTAAELRRTFLDFFATRDHTVVPSAPLVPNDPTLLFTTAGMVQFKAFYTAGDDVPYTRAVSVQKCLRLTDLENVG